MSSDARFLAAFQELESTESLQPALSPEESFNLKAILDQFQLTGAGLSEEQRGQFHAAILRVNSLGAQFTRNVDEEVDRQESQMFVPEAEANRLEGVSATLMEDAKQRARAQELQGYLFRTDNRPGQALMGTLGDEALSKEVERNHFELAADVNLPLAHQILSAKQEAAHLTGFSNFAEMALRKWGTREAPENLLKELEAIAGSVKEQARQELENLERFKDGRISSPREVLFWTHKMKEAQTGVSEERIRQAFPRERILEAVRELCNEILYAEDPLVPRNDVPVWEGGKFYGAQAGHGYYQTVTSSTAGSGTVRNQPGYIHKGIRYPSRPVISYKLPPHLSYPNLVTVFHDRGHLTQHLAFQRKAYPVGGSNGIERLYLEFSSKLMERLARKKEVLERLSEGSLEEHEILQLLATASFQEGQMLSKLVRRAIRDLKLHMEFDPKKGPEQITEIEKGVDEKWDAFPRYPRSCDTLSLSHIMDEGEYGYGGILGTYAWGEILAAQFDAEVLSKNPQGPLDPVMWGRISHEILGAEDTTNPRVLIPRFVAKHSGALERT